MYIVNADNATDALDELIDYLEKAEPGLLMTDKEQREIEREGFDGDYLTGGNHSRMINTFNYRIDKIS